MEFLRTLIRGWREHQDARRPLMLTPLDWKQDEPAIPSKEPRTPRAN